MMSNQEQQRSERSWNDEATPPVMICLLGNFRLLLDGQSVPIQPGGKLEALLTYLALHYGQRVARERLAQALWPASDLARGLNSLHNLVHSVHKILSVKLRGTPAVLHEDGYYRLNVEAGIGVDVARFDAFVAAGNQFRRSGDAAASLVSYSHAIELYRDDLCTVSDAQSVMEGERLRAHYLTLLAQVADHYYAMGDDSTCLEYLWRLLTRDPCREDAHRRVMQCCVRRGERAAALRQYQVCADLLRAEFGASPEPATIALFDQIRLQPHLTST